MFALLWLALGPLGCLPAADLPDLDVDGTPGSLDCNDRDASIHPGADEVCNGVDDDCDDDVDGRVNENAVDASTWYADADADGYGDSAISVVACDAPIDYVADDTDCDDATPVVNPGMTELCDNDVDEDCDGTVCE